MSRVDPASQDFIIASHFFEHCQNPIATLKNFMRVLKPDGVLYLIVPDKAYTYDAPRPSTPIEHIVRDFEEGPAWSCREHYIEYALLVERARNRQDAESRAQYHMDRNYSIHFHVWTKAQVTELFSAANENYQLGYQLRFFLDNGPEGIYILQNAISPGDPVLLRTALPPDPMMAPTCASSPAAVPPVALRPSLLSKVRDRLVGK